MSVVDVQIQNAKLGNVRVEWTDEGGGKNVDHLSVRGLEQQVDYFRDSDHDNGKRAYAVATMQLAAVKEAIGASTDAAE